MSNLHDRPDDRSRERKILQITLTLKIVAAILQVVFGLITGSLALLSDALHVALDVGGNVVGWCAFRVGESKSSIQKQQQIEAVGGGFIGLLICSASLIILWHAYHRFGHEADILSGPVIVVATIGLVINWINLRLLGPHKHLFVIHAVRAHELWDFISSIAVVLCGLVIYATGYNRIDTVASFAIGIMMLLRGIQMCHQAFCHYRSYKAHT